MNIFEYYVYTYELHLNFSAKDDAWTPKVKVRGSPEKMERAARSKKVAAVEENLLTTSDCTYYLNSQDKRYCLS